MFLAAMHMTLRLHGLLHAGTNILIFDSLHGRSCISHMLWNYGIHVA